MAADGSGMPREVRTGKARLRSVALFGVPLLVAAVGVGLWLMGGRYVTTENAFLKADIAQIASEVLGRIETVAVRDHAKVTAGEVLIQLDAEPYRLALAKADAELDSARALVEQAKVALKEAGAEVKEAESRYDFFNQQLQRQKNLVGRGVMPAIKLEQAETDARQAADRVAMLKEKTARALAALGGAPDRPVDQYAVVREKAATRDRAAFDLKLTTIRAPRAGTVVNLKLQPGEQVKPQTALFSIVFDTRPWVEANFKETDLTHVTVGQKAKVTLDIYPGIAWDAVVESVSPATGAEFAILPPQNASGNWVKVVQRLPVKLRLIEKPSEPTLRAGMTASVAIDTGRRRSFSSLIFGGTAVATP